MNKTDFIKKFLELGKHLNYDNVAESVMILNDIEILIDKYQTERYLKEDRYKLSEQTCILFSAEVVYKAINPDSKMDTPNSAYGMMEKKYKQWVEKQR